MSHAKKETTREPWSARDMVFWKALLSTTEQTEQDNKSVILGVERDERVALLARQLEQEELERRKLLVSSEEFGWNLLLAQSAEEEERIGIERVEHICFTRKAMDSFRFGSADPRGSREYTDQAKKKQIGVYLSLIQKKYRRKDIPVSMMEEILSLLPNESEPAKLLRALISAGSNSGKLVDRVNITEDIENSLRDYIRDVILERLVNKIKIMPGNKASGEELFEVLEYLPVSEDPEKFTPAQESIQKLLGMIYKCNLKEICVPMATILLLERELGAVKLKERGVGGI